MILGVQIVSLVFSFFYGVILCGIGYFFRKLLFNKRFLVSFISTFLFMFLFSLLYFIFLWYLNSGIIHEYFLLVFLLGVLFSIFLFKSVKL